MARINPGGAPIRPKPAVAKPKHPNAKTYKDKQGNIREVGTGRLIRKAGAPAAAGKPKGKTFTDAQGTLRRIGGIAVNPLDRDVDAAILTQTAPLSSRVGQSQAQYDAEQSALNGANTAFGSELAAIQARLAGIGSQQLGAAASAAGGTATQQQDQLAYLQNLLGSSMSDSGGLAGQVAALAAQAQSEGAGAAAGIALGQRAGQSDLATMGAANAMRTGVDVRDRMLARDAAVKDYNDQIAAIKANRSGVKMDLQDRLLDQQAARQQIKLAQAEFDHSVEMDDANLTLAEQEAADGGSGGSDDDAATGGKWGSVTLTPEQTALVQTNIDRWRVKTSGKTLASFLAYIRRGGAGVNGTQAARIAMHIFGPNDLKKYAKTRAAFMAAMKNSGVNNATATAWANKVYGKGKGATGGGGGGNGVPGETSDQEIDRLTGGGAHRPYIGKEGKGPLGVRYKVQSITPGANGRFWNWVILVFSTNGTTRMQKLSLRAGQTPDWIK